MIFPGRGNIYKQKPTIMKYLKKYATEQQYLSNSGNTEDSIYYVYDEYTDSQGIVSYTITDSSGSTFGETMEMTNRGKFLESIPGVAYVKNCETTYYNGKQFPHINITYTAGTGSEDYQTYTWEELGITAEIFEQYMQAAKAHSYYKVYNITVNGNDIMNSLLGTTVVSYGNSIPVIELNPGVFSAAVNSPSSVYDIIELDGRCNNYRVTIFYYPDGEKENSIYVRYITCG
jgi:hypothetical protein